VGDLPSELLDRFRWVSGHADVWRLFYEGDLFARLSAALADPFRSEAITKVAGIEARGLILGSAVALELRAGFVAVRKSDGLFPGEKLSRLTPADYRGVETRLRLQRDSLSPGDRVLLVDDWFETGSQALTAVSLIEEAGAELVGASVIVDQLPAGRGDRLGRYCALVSYSALPQGGTL
jgi:adenine phosphoribosyltransferase